MSPKTAKRRASRKYSGARRKHVLKEGLGGRDMQGENSGSGPELGGPRTSRQHGPGRQNTTNATNGAEDHVPDPTAVEQDSEYEKPYEYESEVFNSPVSSGDDGTTAYDTFDEDTKYGEVQFKVGQLFPTMESFKKALKDYFVHEDKDVLYIKNEKLRVRAACVKTLYNEHNCGRDFGSNLADRAWVTDKLVKKLFTEPDLKLGAARDHIIDEYNVKVNIRMVARALKVAREVVIGSEKAQYGKTRDYLMELHRSNPGSTALMEVIPQPESLPLFDRLYISLDTCKKGFKEGCRPLIGLDGCFLKGRYGGQLLSAVGQDANNHFYVIAYAVVPNECKETWKWFLTLLKEDLGEDLELAMKDVNTTAHHRNCVLHIWKNFIKHFKDEQTKQMVWECSHCTTIQEFRSAMEKLKKLNEGAWEYLQRFDPGVWCKAYFSHGPKVDNITNNMCEVWNAKIFEYRKKLILSMCEDLRCYIMRKRAMHKKRLEHHTGILAPVQQKKLDQFIKPKSTKWRATWAGNSDRVLFEVHMQRHKVGVNLQSKTCTCNVWQLTGMPCRHAVAAMAKMGLKAEDFVHKWLTMDAIKSGYSVCINPVNSEEYWNPTDSP
ncbi:uncharacterized protein LOC107481097 [Arachis duranensis]|uniref:Uncharacterized protein LOC107481097 n=1 Tax=Arachis duranensis TaxID=130453 RepID=A0A6P4CZA2_ARADU|nr:uncharacterized protein LOC107481097 [Arachis duranensis]